MKDKSQESVVVFLTLFRHTMIENDEITRFLRQIQAVSQIFATFAGKIII